MLAKVAQSIGSGDEVDAPVVSKVDVPADEVAPPPPINEEEVAGAVGAVEGATSIVVVTFVVGGNHDEVKGAGAVNSSVLMVFSVAVVGTCRWRGWAVTP